VAARLELTAEASASAFTRFRTSDSGVSLGVFVTDIWISRVVATALRRPVLGPWQKRRALGVCSFGERDERLALLDDIRDERGAVDAADVLHRVDRFGRNHQGLAGRDRPWRLPFDLVLQFPFENVGDLLAVVKVLEGKRFWAELDAVLDDLACGDA
jgi:hypothetical protein